MVEKGDKNAGLRGVMHDGTADPIEAAARLLGKDPKDFEELRGLSLEELEKRNARTRARLEAEGEHG